MSVLKFDLNSSNMNLKKLFLLGTLAFVIVCLGLFYILNTSLSLRSSKIDYGKVESKLKVLENAVNKHGDSMKELESLIVLAPDSQTLIQGLGSDTGGKESGKFVADPDFVHDQDVDGDVDNDNKVVKPPPNEIKHQKSGVCSAAVGIGIEATSDINMLGVYEELPFDDPDGGVWKQGWDISINTSRFSDKNKLKIFVIPHSHNDPGWIKTFENYFETQTKNILNTMLEKLSLDSSLKFIWCEISYFSLWWDELSDNDKLRVKKIVASKQLEFVTGGWVMPDEANSHHYSMLVQMIEGHQWLLHHLDYIPKNGWSIDPFGMSPTNAYLLRRTGLSNMVIQRTHYAVKKYLARRQELEFKWRQNWDTKGSADMLCHLMPFYSYDIPHTCGPDPSVCCQFDFKRMRSVSHLTCPWHKPPIPIKPQNVRERATTLLEQYKKRAMLYKTNTLLVPLGDDFRWESGNEWDAQTKNYGNLFNYINSHEEFHAEAKFGTLEDYFEALGNEISSGQFSPKVLSGDFFTYADRSNHYWSGYFTSRPFHKAADRQLISLLKGAQLAYTLMTAEVSRKWGNPENYPFIRGLLGKIIKSRRTLSLFQHHDGITGTSKDHVVSDYAKKLHTALNDCNHVMQQSLHVLTHLTDEKIALNDISEDTNFYDAVISKDTPVELPHYNLIFLDREISQKVVKVFNPSLRKRTQHVRLYLSTYKVEVSDLHENKIPFEIMPVFESQTTISKNNFELNFVAEIDALSTKNFIIEHSSSSKIIPTPEILVFNSPTPNIQHDFFAINHSPSGEPIQISNGYITIDCDVNGFMKAVSINGQSHPVGIKMFSYGVQSSQETSGLYLFLPDGEATPLPVHKPLIKVIKGKFMSYVEVSLTQIKHRILLYNHAGLERHAVEIKNLVDIRNERNFELSMRISSDIESNNLFYTDLNGFQMIRRKWFSKLPIQANFYPVPAAAYVESNKLRMTVLSGQPLGGASLKSGDIELIMDRRLMQDDNRGAGQGCTDNLESMNIFKLMFESPSCEDKQSDRSPPMLSLQAHLHLQDLLSPFQLFTAPRQLTGDTLSDLEDYTLRTSNELACDVELLSAIPLPEYTNAMDDHSYVATDKSALLFHRVGFDGRFDLNVPNCSQEDSKLGRFTVKQIFGDLIESKLTQMTLSFLHEGRILNYNESILMKPVEIYGFVVNFNHVL